MPTYTFNSGSGTFTVPAGEALSQIVLWGGGAGGGAGDGAPKGGASGGGSGAYVLKNQVAGAGTNINYSVGAGGAANTIPDDGNPGSPGGASTVSTYSLSAGGGQVGANFQAAGAGGTASGGDTNTNGNASAANTGSNTGTNGASAPNGGTGGTGGGSSSPDATAGTAPGAGGGGGGRHTIGGAGAAGRITFTTTLVVTSNSPDDLTDAEYTWYKTRSTSTVAKSPLVEMQRTYWISVVGATGSGISNQEIEMKWLRSLTGVTSSQYGDMWREAVAGIGKVPQNSISQNKLIYYKNVP